MKVLVVDIGGTSIKILATGHHTPIKIPSGPRLTPTQMVRQVQEAIEGWEYSVVSIGYPGPVKDGKPVKEPKNLGRGWVGFDFARAFGRPVRIINDAAMQALGSYQKGRMLFLGLGTGLGTTLILDGVVAPLELAHLPYKNGKTYEQYVGKAGLERTGKRKWRRNVADVTNRLRAALEVDDVVIGGGNAKLLKTLPTGARAGKNGFAFVGGYRLWGQDVTTRVMLVRHGATVLSAEDRFAGSSDVQLGDDGRMQVERLAQRLATESIAAIYGSPLRRAQETATILARPHNMTVTALDDLREIAHGRWEGLRREEAATMYPEEYAAWEHDPFNFAPAGGESGERVLERGVRAFREIVIAHPGESVLVVSHKATIRLIVAHVLGIDPRGYRDRLDQLPACLNMIDMYQDGTGRLILLNDVSHYTWVPRQTLATCT